MFSAPFLSTLLNRVKAIVRGVARPVAERTPVVRARAPVAAISAVLRGRAQRWMRTKLQALSALMRRIEAGQKLSQPVRTPITRAGADARAAWVAVPPEERLPRGFGWMCAFGPDVRCDGAAFVEWLNEPVQQAMILAAPERMVRLIGPILTATGASRPEWFPVVEKRRKRSSHPRADRSEWVKDAAGSCEDGLRDSECRCSSLPPTPPARGGGICVLTAPGPEVSAMNTFPPLWGKAGMRSGAAAFCGIAASTPAIKPANRTFSILKRTWNNQNLRPICFDIKTTIHYDLNVRPANRKRCSTAGTRTSIAPARSRRAASSRRIRSRPV